MSATFVPDRIEHIAGLRRAVYGGGRSGRILIGGYAPLNFRTGQTIWTSKVRIPTSAGRVDFPSFCYWNGYTLGSASGEGDATAGVGTLRIAVEYPANIFTRGWFGPRGRDASFEPGQVIWSDPVGVSIPQGAAAWILVSQTVPSSANQLPYSYTTSTALAEGFTNGGDFTTTIGGVAAFAGAVNAPLAIAGASSAVAVPTVAILGDSIAQGLFTGNADANFITLGLDNDYFYANLARTGDRAQYYNSATIRTHAARDHVTDLATHAIVCFGANDLAASRTAVQLRADLDAIGTELLARGITAYVCTVPPRTTGTFTSEAGQTLPAWEAERLAFNAALRASPTPYAGVCDLDLQVRGTDIGKWKATGGVARTDDGVHPNAQGKIDGAAAVTALLPLRLK